MTRFELADLPASIQRQIAPQLRRSATMTAEQVRLLESEASFQRRVIALAEAHRWLVYHVYEARRSNPGFPDLVLTRGGRLIFAELKTVKGRVSVEQSRWLGHLGAVPGVLAVVWRPGDWTAIEAVLALPTDSESLTLSLSTSRERYKDGRRG